MKDLQIELNQMARDPAYGEFAYLTFDDIGELNNQGDSGEHNSDTLIAVKAPLGTKVEMLDDQQLYEDYIAMGYTPQ